ncbi:hypothetical protein A0H81_00887 [Grifola frondosa]|uniref:Pentacotripeptide-repeat region of PRORP domain-containing protein n=1 Tax=Grifola frondosa TaxID=5627 RepID=A0A1C7MR11_GRIFR|nr:hypothetical protein A0H81_00887 [Grifola frondosa]
MAAVVRQERDSVLRRGWAATAANLATGHRDEPSRPVHEISGTSEYLHPTAGINLPRRLSYRALTQPLLRSLISRRVRSDRATFAIRIRHDAVVKGDIEMANRSFQAMLDCGLHPNQYHFAALMEGYAQAGDMAGAVDLAESAVRMGITVGVKMYTILIAGYARLGEPTHAMRVFHDMVEAGIRPDIAAVDAVASAFFAVGACSVARRVLLQLWPSVAPVPDEISGASLLELARTFRAMDIGSGGRDDSQRFSLSSQERRMLRWKVRKIVHIWRERSRDGDSGAGLHHVSNGAPTYEQS